MGAGEETQPLLVSAKKKTSASKTYSALGYNNRNGSTKDLLSENGSSVYLETLSDSEKKHQSNGYSSGGGGGGDPASVYVTPDLPKENITYTWSNINVFTRTEQRQNRVLSTIENVIQGNKPRGRKHILKNVTGVAYPGELMALMGSSGAGKTTLLNSLTFRAPVALNVTGCRAINGVPVTANALGALSAYVQQDDLFIGTLTVREHLIFQALVRMDRHIPYSQRMIRVEEVINELMLTRCQNTVIGVPGKIKGISGGEMKRLSFASEVLTNPPLMFCDEPTSGLDSYMAQNVVTVLKSLANKGKTIVCTIHQPSSEVFSMFDKILLMAEGRVAFLGTPQEAIDFFKTMGAVCPSHYNPADFFIQLLAVVPNAEESCRNMIEMVCDSFSTSDIGAKISTIAEVKGGPQVKSMWTWSDPFASSVSMYKASWYAQFKAVFWRSWLSVNKEPVLIKVRLLQTLMVSLMIGLIYFGQDYDQDGVMNINGALFICISNMTFQNVFAVITVFCSEMPVFMREHHNGMYRTDVYFLCKTLAEVPIFLAIPVLFTAIMYYMVGLNPAPAKFLQAMIIITLVSNVATSFGYFISCVSSSISVALSIGPPIVIPFLLFGGFFLNVRSVPPYFKWLSNLSWFKYGNEALLINQWSDIESIACTRSNTTCPRDGLVVLEEYSFSVSHYLMDYVWLIVLIIGFRLTAFLALLYRSSRRR
ncbi:protein white-like [Macrosteles quadrilineatus]|uniref:protein white-like n=1 Tax=Macrosteles quadrilineatus TaxID=74068 RepID=UPI0023E09B8B|nr:protein white-like [Macrosteles quadrilineatus]